MEPHLINTIDVFAPRWHDKIVLIADWKIVPGSNRISIRHHSYARPFYMSSAKLWTYPIEHIKRKNGGTSMMRAVPLDDLIKSTDSYFIIKTVEEVFP